MTDIVLPQPDDGARILPTGFLMDVGVRFTSYSPALVRRLIRDAVAAERERCAKLCEGNHILSGGNGPNFSAGWESALSACANAIRKEA